MTDDDKQDDGFDPWAELESIAGSDAEDGGVSFDEPAEAEGGDTRPAAAANESDPGFMDGDDEISGWLADVSGEIEPAPLGVFSGDDEPTGDVGDPEAVRVGFGESGIVDDDAPVSAIEADGIESSSDPEAFDWGEVEIDSVVEPAPFGVVGTEPDDAVGEATDFGGVPPGSGSDVEAADDTGALVAAAAGGAAAIVSGTKPVGRRRAKKGGVGQIIGITLGGLLALPITFAILTWGFRKDPLNIVRQVPPSLAFLFPQELVAGGRASGGPGGRGPTLDDVPVVTGLEEGSVTAPEPMPTDEPTSEPAALPDGQEIAATDAVMDPTSDTAAVPADAPPVEEPLGDVASGPATVDVADAAATSPLAVDGVVAEGTPMPDAVAVDPFAGLAAPLQPASEAVATIVPQEPAPVPSPEPEPLDLTAIETAVAAADEAIRAVEAAGDDVDPDPVRQARRRNRLLVDWYRQLALVAEELAALERLAADTGRPLDGPPAAVARLQAAALADPARLDDLARLSRDWLAYGGRSTSGIVIPAVLAGVRHVGPYWCSTVTVAEPGDRTRDLVAISRSEPAAAIGATVLVTGLIVDGNTLWASDVRPAQADPATTVDPFAVP